MKTLCSLVLKCLNSILNVKFKVFVDKEDDSKQNYSYVLYAENKYTVLMIHKKISND